MDNLNSELEELKQELAHLTVRLKQFENKLAQVEFNKSQASHEVHNVNPDKMESGDAHFDIMPPPLPASPQSPISSQLQSIPAAPQSPVSPPPPVPQLHSPLLEPADHQSQSPQSRLLHSPLLQPAHQQSQNESRNFESRVGLYWLNRLGIGSLVIGIALLIMYSFQYFGPILKIIMGLSAGIALIVLAERMQQNQQDKEEGSGFNWYAHGLIGGGWSLIYFVAYAMYHIASVRIFPTGGSPAAELAWALTDYSILLGVSALAIWHALKRNSQAIAGFAFILAFITTGLGPMGNFTLASFAVIVAALSYLSAKKQWYRLFMLGVLVCYSVFLLALQSRFVDFIDTLAAAGNKDKLYCNYLTAMLGTCWLLFNWVLLKLSDEKEAARKRIVIAGLVNCMAFVIPVLAAAHDAYPLFHGWFLLLVGTIYGLVAHLAFKNNRHHLTLLNSMLGLTLITVSVASFLTNHWKYYLWLAEFALIFTLGLKYRIPTLRYFAYMLGLALFFSAVLRELMAHNGELIEGGLAYLNMYALVSVGVFGSIAGLLKFTPRGVICGPKERELYFSTYIAYAIFLMWLFAVMEAPAHLRALCCGLEGLAVIYLGLKANSQLVRTLGGMTMASCSTLMVVNREQSSIVMNYFALACLPAASWCYWWYRQNLEGSIVRFGVCFYLTLAFFAFGMLALLETPGVTAVASTVAGTMMVLLGIYLPSKYIRILGTIGMVVLFPVLLFNAANLNVWRSILVSVSYYAVGCGYRYLSTNQGKSNQLYLVAAIVLLSVRLSDLVPGSWLALAWTIEGLLLLTVGFKLQEKAVRISGLLLLVTAAIRILISIFSSAEPLVKIISCIIAGLVLLACSYGYTRRLAKVDEDIISKS